MGYRKEDAYRRLRYLVETHIKSERRPAADDLLDFLWQDGRGSFFVAPASSRKAYHMCQFGGLALHTINLILILLDTVEGLFGGRISGLTWGTEPHESAQDLDAWRESAVIVGLCHDLNKTRLFNIPRYVPAQKLKSGKDPTNPYEYSGSDPSGGDGHRPALGNVESLLVALVGGGFTEWRADELQAVLWVEGKYDRAYDQHVGGKEHALTLMAHWADMASSHIVERVEPVRRGKKTLRSSFAGIEEPDLVPDPFDGRPPGVIEEQSTEEKAAQITLANTGK